MKVMARAASSASGQALRGTPRAAVPYLSQAASPQLLRAAANGPLGSLIA